jgi:uncharacterized membrane protein
MRSGKMVATGLLGMVLLLYPAFVYVGLAHGRWQVVGVAILILTAFRLALARSSTDTGRFIFAPSAAAIALVTLALLSGSPNFLLYYPVAMNAAMLVLFVASLRYPPTVIERLARLHQPDLPPSGVLWTHKVTVVWCLFFVFNGAAALATILSGDLALWTLYNGIISYIAMGVLMAGEFVARRIVIGQTA